MTNWRLRAEIAEGELAILSAKIKQSYPTDSSGWISVADRLPEVDGKYLCWIEETPPWPSSGCVVLDFDRREEPVWSSNASRYITHWMPLPAAPEDKS